MKQYLLGGVDLNLFLASLFFAGLGIFFVLMMGTGLRDKDSNWSPYKFSFDYLFSDNAKRIYASTVAVILTLRFMTELTGWELTPFKGLVIGMAWDSIALFIKQKTNILDPKKPE